MKQIDKLAEIHELERGGVAHWTFADSYRQGFKKAKELAIEAVRATNETREVILQMALNTATYCQTQIPEITGRIDYDREIEARLKELDKAVNAIRVLGELELL